MTTRVVTQEYLDGLLDEIERLRVEVQRGCPHVIAPIDRFKNLYIVDENDCWLWQGTVNNSGYGKFFFDGKKVYAHRWSYAYHVADIPEGMQVDHLCFKQTCVNPTHLRILTPEANNQRKKPRK